jgi:plasmid replication initiation protein
MKRKDYQHMTVEELAEATKQFDQPDVIEQSSPLGPDDVALWRRVKTKRGRPQIGKGFQRISVSIERSLLSRVNSFAKRKKLSRSKLLADLLKRALDEDSQRHST